MKQIIINNCSVCPYHKQQAERIIKNGSQYWRHNCEISRQTIFDEDREGEETLSDQPIPSWCKLENY